MKNEKLAAQVKRDVATPYHMIELHNGARVLGFSSGAKNATTVRGQKADFVILDEADYLSQGDIDTVTALLMEHNHVSLFCASTPSGKREAFYGWCENNMRYKQFHFPSMVNPFWGPEMEDELREEYRTEEAWAHEILAEWGEQATGVFQSAYIDRAKREYRYEGLVPKKGCTYTLGADWNDTENGTRIYITEFNPVTGSFRPVEKALVQKEGWTQTAAIEKIVHLNRKWRPSYIYVDQGYGATQVEVLKRIGVNAKYGNSETSRIDSKLQEVKAINSAEKLEIYDPVTQMPAYKLTKPFAVESLVRKFENEQVLLSEYDIDLENQLHGYTEIRKRQDGSPVYQAGPAGDHDLDAFVLSMLAFEMEMSDLTTRIYSTKIGFSGRINEGHEEGVKSREEATKSNAESQATPKKPEAGYRSNADRRSLLPNGRITSYNVCYTKLLRHHSN